MFFGIQARTERKAVKMMRDRLIELIRNAPRTDVVYGDIKLDEPVQTLQTIADHLLANGVIVPPCYIGQDIWHTTKHYDGRIEIGKGKVSMLQQKADKSWKIRITVNSSVWDFTPSEIGKIYFFSKEEAERALKGGEG
jgi:hypothetical protein